MNQYELTYLLNPNLEEPKSLAEELTELVKDQGATLDSKKGPRQIELGSPIKPKLKKGKLSEVLIGTITFHHSSEKVNQLRERINQKEGVLRTMLVSKEERPSEPEVKPQSQKKKKKKVELEDIDQKLDEILKE